MLEQGITYNTTMALVAGAIPLLAIVFARVAQRPYRQSLAGWAYMFAALGLFLAITGTHMTLTWPLEQVEGAFCCAVDNITFGEPAMFYGFLTFFAALAILRAEKAADDGKREFDLVAVTRPFLYAGAFGGVGLILIGIAGMHYGMWRPPPTEPIAGLLAGSLAEPLFMMLAYVLTGVAALFAPFAPEHKWIGRIGTGLLLVVGLMWTFIAFTVFFSHVGFFPQPV